MANGLDRGTYTVRDIGDEVQVPDANLRQDADDLFLPVGHVASAGERAERISIPAFMQYLNNELPLRGQLTEFLDMLNRLHNTLQAEQAQRNSLDARVQNNGTDIGDLGRRVAALETSRPQPTMHAGSIRYGVLDQHGVNVGVEETANYIDLPADVRVVFPAASSSTDVWYFDVDANVTASDIINVGFSGADESTLWTFDSTARRYTFTDVTPGLSGSYSIRLTLSGG